MPRPHLDKNMAASQPEISVCIPAYNCGRFVQQAIAGVLCQSYQDFEIIVYDDASTDDTAQVVASISDARVRYFRNARNLGVAATRNHCLAAARGKYVAWLDADDIYYPHALEMQRAVLECYAHVGLAYGAYHVIDGHGQRLPDWPQPHAAHQIEKGHEVFRELILENFIATPTVMARRACYEQVGAFSETLGKIGEDWDMWLRMALHTDFAFIATPIMQCRQHQQSMTAGTRKLEQWQCDARVVQHVLPLARVLRSNTETLQTEARAALAARALLCANDAFTRSARAEALRAVAKGYRIATRLMPFSEVLRLLLAIVRNHDYAQFRGSRKLLQHLHRPLAATRLGRRLQKQVEDDTAWHESQQRIAAIMRQHVPKAARVLIAAKWDPTLLHLSQRRGWNFPHRALMPEGYPANDASALDHLEQMQKRGARYLVFPNAAFWWLEHYRAFRRRLEEQHACVWNDQQCVIYQLKKA